MNRKIILFPLAMAAILGLASCSGEQPQQSSSEPEASQVPSSEEPKKATIAINEGDISLEVGAIKALTVKVENIDNKNVTWASSETTIATVEAGVVTAVKEGTAKITATLDADNTIKAEITVTVTPKVMTAKKVSIEDLVTGNGIVEGTLYEAEGILEGLSHNDVFGNAYLTDVATSKTVKVYGLTTTESALAEADGAYTFTNPKDAKTTLADVNNGEKVTIWGVYTTWAKNISGILKSHAAGSGKYTATFETNQNASISLDKTENLSYGETVAVTVTPAAGYVVDSVKIETLYGAENAVLGADGKYTFGATCSNKVVVSVSQPASGSTTFDFTASGKLGEFGLGNGYTNASATISGVKFDAISAAANKQNDWQEYVLCLGAKGGASASLTISGKTFNSMTLNYRWWGTLTLVISSSNDGTNWNELSSENTPTGVNYGTSYSFTTADDFASASYFKIEIKTTTSQKNNQRIGISSIVLDIAA